MALGVCLAGPAGWAGSALARAMAATDDITLTSAASRTHAGHLVADVLGESGLKVPVFASAS